MDTTTDSISVYIIATIILVLSLSRQTGAECPQAYTLQGCKYRRPGSNERGHRLRCEPEQGLVFDIHDSLDDSEYNNGIVQWVCCAGESRDYRRCSDVQCQQDAEYNVCMPSNRESDFQIQYRCEAAVPPRPIDLGTPPCPDVNVTASRITTIIAPSVDVSRCRCSITVSNSDLNVRMTLMDSSREVTVDECARGLTLDGEELEDFMDIQDSEEVACRPRTTYRLRGRCEADVKVTFLVSTSHVMTLVCQPSLQTVTPAVTDVNEVTSATKVTRKTEVTPLTDVALTTDLSSVKSVTSIVTLVADVTSERTETMAESPNNPKKADNTAIGVIVGAVIGGVIGALLIVVVIALVLVTCLRKKTNPQKQSQSIGNPVYSADKTSMYFHNYEYVGPEPTTPANPHPTPSAPPALPVENAYSELNEMAMRSAGHRPASIHLYLELSDDQTVATAPALEDERTSHSEMEVKDNDVYESMTQSGDIRLVDNPVYSGGDKILTSSGESDSRRVAAEMPTSDDATGLRQDVTPGSFDIVDNDVYIAS